MENAKMMDKRVSLKVAMALIVIAVLVSSILVYVLAVSPTSTFTISPGVYPGAPSFTVWTEGSNYFAKDANGLLVYSGTNASYIVNTALHSDIGYAAHASLFFKDGLYYFDSPIIIQREYVNIKGESKGGTVLIKTANINLIESSLPVDYTRCGWFDLRDLTLRGSSYTGALLKLTNWNDVNLENLFMQNNTGSAIVFDNVWVGMLHFNEIWHSGRDSTNEPMVNFVNGTNLIRVHDSIFDDWNYTGIIIDATSSTNSISHCMFEGWIDDNNYPAIVISGIHNIITESEFVYINNNYAMIRNLGYYNTISENIIISVSQKGTGIDAYGCGYGIITNNIFRNLNTSIEVDAISMTIKDNVFQGCTKNYLTENSGTATISASTTVTFNHGLAGTPTLVLASFNVAGWGDWKWSATSTQITITTNQTITAECYWHAEYKP